MVNFFQYKSFLLKHFENHAFVHLVTKEKDREGMTFYVFDR